MKAKKPTEESTIQQAIQEFIGVIGIEGTFEMSLSEDTIDVLLQTEESGIVIGYHGETLEALQLILSLMIAKKIDRFLRVSIEVGDYKKNRIDWLERVAMQTKEAALSQQREIALPSLKPWERRIVHVLLKDDGEVTSESVGEGRDRTLVIKPRS